MRIEALYIGAAVLVLGLLAYIAAKGPAAAGKAAGKALGEGAGGVVKGIGESLGIPDTDEKKCEACIAAGDKWCASKYCAAPRFIGALWNGEFKKPAAAPAPRASQADVRRSEETRLNSSH